MTPHDAAHILEPIWQGFTAARCRLHHLRETLDTADRTDMARQVSETLAAEEYLQALLQGFLCSESGGLLTIIQRGKKSCAWPNAYPNATARRLAEVAYFARRFEADLSIQLLRRASGV